MMAKTIEAAIADPDGIEVSVTIRMPLSDWKKLSKQLQPNEFPSSWIARDIRSAIAQFQSSVMADLSPET